MFASAPVLGIAMGTRFITFVVRDVRCAVVAEDARAINAVAF